MFGFFRLSSTVILLLLLATAWTIDAFTIISHSLIRNNVRKYGVASLQAAILPISPSRIYNLKLVHRDVTSTQWMSYWGASSKERSQRIQESLLLAYAGAWFAWFVSFMSGGLAPFIGTLLIFNWMYSPYINARNRNGKFWSQSKSKSYAIYTGEIIGLNKLIRRSGKTIGAANKEFLEVIIEDESGRQLEVITQWQESYRRLTTGMACDTMIVSTSNFRGLDLVTDVYVENCNVWFGDFPYLNKKIFKEFMETMEATNELVKETRSMRNDNISNKRDLQSVYYKRGDKVCDDLGVKNSTSKRL